MATVPDFEEQMVTVEEYEEDGPPSVHRLNVLADDSM